jgi:hypothetical protein
MILPSVTYILVLGRRHFDVDSGVVRDNILLFRVQRRLVLSRLFSFLKEHLPDLAATGSIFPVSNGNPTCPATL